VKFYLGTHRPSWLGRLDVPLLVSHATLAGRRTLPQALAGWACDSGAFSEVAARGAEAFPAGHGPYVAAVRRYRDEVGQLAWAAPQDWMCEPWMVAKTGLTVAEHQRRTVANLLAVREAAPDLPVVPVLQGWTPAEYETCAGLYASAGVDLRAEPLVGLGSVCRRQATGGIAGLVADLWADGVRLHAFGLKLTGLPFLAPYLASADSMAWSFDARRARPLPGCTHRSCANCPRYALVWRDRVLARTRATQPALFGANRWAAS
jgi:hypothetical protein